MRETEVRPGFGPRSTAASASSSDRCSVRRRCIAQAPSLESSRAIDVLSRPFSPMTTRRPRRDSPGAPRPVEILLKAIADALDEQPHRLAAHLDKALDPQAHRGALAMSASRRSEGVAIVDCADLKDGAVEIVVIVRGSVRHGARAARARSSSAAASRPSRMAASIWPSRAGTIFTARGTAPRCRRRCGVARQDR